MTRFLPLPPNAAIWTLEANQRKENMLNKIIVNPADSRHMLLTLAAGEGDPSATESIKVIRASASTIATAVASMLDFLDEPLKSAFVKVKSDINTMLASLPPTDQVPAALNSADLLRSLMCSFQMAQSMMSSISEYGKQSRAELVTARNSMPTDIENAITAKVTAGDLLKKDDVQAKIEAAVTAAKNDFTQGQKIVSDRRVLLTTASLPVPADEKLLGKDEEFNPRKETAKTRAEALKTYKVEPNQLLQLCWDADQTSFDLALNLLKANAVAAPAAPAPFTPGRPPIKQASGYITTVRDPEIRKHIGAI